MALAAACAPGAQPETSTVDDTGAIPTEPADVAPELYAFLAAQQDADSGLLESFVDHPDLPLDFSAYLQATRPSFTYDNALAVIAWLSRGSQDDLARASSALQGLVTIQHGTGAMPDVVHVLDLTPSERHSTGNQAWAMLALLAGHEVLHDEAWLLSAERIGAYLLDPSQELQNPAGFGGYRLQPGATAVATEHNLDLYAAFERLADALPTSAGRLSAAEVRTAAQRARLFAESRFDPLTGAVFTGTEGDGVLSNEAVVPLDAQTWSLLSLGRAKWIEGYRWALRSAPAGLWVTSPACVGVAGPPFSDADRGDVWIEGLAQMRTAARLIADADADLAMGLALDRVRDTAPHGDGRGLVATCSQIDTGFGFAYYNALAVGPSAWTALAATGMDPFWFRPLASGLGSHPAAGLPTVRLAVPDGARYSCSGNLPCRFTVTGTSSGVVGTSQRLFLLVQPTAPVAVGRFFTQAAPATVQADGSWSVSGQLGDGMSPVQPGDVMRLAVLVVDGAAPTLELPVVTPDTVESVVTTSGLLDATVQ